MNRFHRFFSLGSHIATFCVLLITPLTVEFLVLHGLKFIHRDLKPANVFFSRDRQNVKIGDFGLMTTAESDESLKEKSFLNFSAAVGPNLTESKCAR